MPLTWGRFSRETISLRPNVMIGSDIFYDENDFEQILCNMQYRKNLTFYCLHLRILVFVS